MTAGLWTVARSAAAYGQYGTSGEYYKLSLKSVDTMFGKQGVIPASTLKEEGTRRRWKILRF